MDPIAESPHASRLAVPGSIAVAVVAGALAFPRIAEQMPWADETQTVGYCLGTWGEGFHLATHSQNMPVGYWLIAKIVYSIAGPSFAAMRYPSAVAFVAFGVLLLWLLMRWFPPWLALVATLVVVLHPALVWHARDARVYTILLLAETASVSLLLARPFRGREVLWGLSSAGMVYLHHHAIFVLVFEAALLLALRAGRRREEEGQAPSEEGVSAAFADRLPRAIHLIWIAVLAGPDLLFVTWAMGSPNVATQMFGTGQTFAPNVLMAVDRLGAGIPEMIPLPIPDLWRKLLGGAMLVLAAGLTSWRGRAVHAWLGLGVLWMLIVPAALHDALDVFYEPRFALIMIPAAIVWLIGSATLLPTRWPPLLLAVPLGGLFLWNDLEVVRPHISPYRPARAEINDKLAELPGKIVIHPGYLMGCWPLPDGYDTAGGVLLSDTGAMKGVEKQMADENAERYSPAMPWSVFRREVVRGESFTVLQGSPAFYPRRQVDFAQPDEPWTTGYELHRMWPNHPFVTIIRFERKP